MTSSNAPSETASTVRRQLLTFPGLKAADFQHPADAVATKALKAIPGLDFVVAKVLEYGLERALYVSNIASNVRVTDKMFPRVHENLKWACRILDVAEPQLYVQTDPRPNAWTFGHRCPYITVTTGLLDLLGDEERFFVLGHELGHVKAGHALYMTLARNIAAVMALVGQLTLGAGTIVGAGLELALLEWQRRAELTADRAGMLCTQSFKPCTRTFMKLAGGSQRLRSEMDEVEFLKQVHAYAAADESALNAVYKVLLTAQRSHPFILERAGQLWGWRESGYGQLVSRLRAAGGAADEGKAPAMSTR